VVDVSFRTRLVTPQPLNSIAEIIGISTKLEFLRDSAGDLRESEGAVLFASRPIWRRSYHAVYWRASRHFGP
jgi:hypothetical protein